jgi:nitroimidazol reductase NimA-like FMN-containing flavoprotein (pyridoxamine 5'-phosphate oxidase superfamily)
MPKLTPAEIDDFLDERGHLIRIGTVDASGMPRVVPLWFIRDGDDIVFTPRTASMVHVNLARDPRVGFSIDDAAAPYRKVAVQGTAVTRFLPGHDDEWRELYRRIAERYVTAEGAAAYITATIAEPRALYAVPLGSPSSTQTWRMPVTGENGRGIWAERYYLRTPPS